MNARELKNQVKREAGAINCGIGGFYILSPELGAFYEKLNVIGARNIKIIRPETVPDIDATVELEDSEAETLITEFRALLAKVQK
jgi:hypothetical protein